MVNVVEVIVELKNRLDSGATASRDGLERLVMGNGATPAGVPSFVRKWRAAPGEDDNYVYAIALP